jgi:hypothetical protein
MKKNTLALSILLTANTFVQPIQAASPYNTQMATNIGHYVGFGTALGMISSTFHIGTSYTRSTYSAVVATLLNLSLFALAPQVAAGTAMISTSFGEQNAERKLKGQAPLTPKERQEERTEMANIASDATIRATAKYLLGLAVLGCLTQYVTLVAAETLKSYYSIT